MEQCVETIGFNIDNVDIVEKDGKLVVKTWFKISCYMETSISEKEQVSDIINRDIRKIVNKASEEVRRTLKRSLEF